ncbi:MAG: hypothetical protein IKD04_08130 [Clostridia bacterium]|nr:hypothetical protein [Clostridia bacterium]
MLGFTVSAGQTAEVTPHGEFATDMSVLSKSFGMTEAELSQYKAENGIIYIAVNDDNTKQIRISCNTTDFSNSVVNISSLSDDKLTALIPDIVGIDGARGEIINKNGQKFIKIQLRTSDSGGEYIITRYITVADRQCFELMFYTDSGADTAYIEKTFNTFDADGFISENTGVNGVWFYIIPIGIAVFLCIAVIVGITVIRDIKKKNCEE